MRDTDYHDDDERLEASCVKPERTPSPPPPVTSWSEGYHPDLNGHGPVNHDHSGTGVLLKALNRRHKPEGFCLGPIENMHQGPFHINVDCLTLYSLIPDQDFENMETKDGSDSKWKETYDKTLGRSHELLNTVRDAVFEFANWGRDPKDKTVDHDCLDGITDAFYTFGLQSCFQQPSELMNAPPAIMSNAHGSILRSIESRLEEVEMEERASQENKKRASELFEEEDGDESSQISEDEDKAELSAETRGEYEEIKRRILWFQSQEGSMEEKTRAYTKLLLTLENKASQIG